MTTLQKILIYIGAILLIGGVGFIIYNQFKISERQTAIEQQVVATKQLADNISRAQASWGTKEDIEAAAKQNNVNLKVIQDDLDKLHAEISAINTVSVISHGQSGTNVPPTTTNPGENAPPFIVASKCFDKNSKEIPCFTDPYGYMSNKQTLQLNEQFDNIKAPIGSVSFESWKPAPFSYNILQREYKITTVLGKDENDREYAYNKMSIVVNNKNYDVKITKNDFVQQYPEAKFRFSPHLYAGVGTGVNITNSPVKGEFTPSLTLGLFNYGTSKNNPAISIGQIGVGYGTVSERPQIVVNPVNFNVGKLVPGNLANNTYFGPSLQVGTDGNVVVGVGITTGF